LDVKTNKIYDSLTPRAKIVYDELKKHPDIFVRELCKKVHMQTETVEKCLDELFDNHLASFYWRGKRKCWFILNAISMNYNEIDKARKEEIQNIKKIIQESVAIYQKNKDSKSFNLLLAIVNWIMHEISIIASYKIGVKEKDFLNTWKDHKHQLEKLFIELMNADPIRLYYSLKTTEGLKSHMLRRKIESKIKELSVEAQTKELEEK